jgi:hypothetical protein
MGIIIRKVYICFVALVSLVAIQLRLVPKYTYINDELELSPVRSDTMLIPKAADISNRTVYFHEELEISPPARIWILRVRTLRTREN